MADAVGGVADLREVGATLGVEEEFHLLQPATGDLVPAARRVLRRDLLDRRRELAEATADIGLAVASVGTVPGSGTHRGRVFPDPRYEWMAAEYRQLVDEQQVCACQVHVSVDNTTMVIAIVIR